MAQDSLGRMRGKVSWGGELLLNSVPPSRGLEYPWAQAREELEGEEVQLVRSQVMAGLSEEEERVSEYLGFLLKEGQGEAVPYSEIKAQLDQCARPFEAVLNICSASSDFREGKVKSLTGSLVLSLQRWARERPDRAPPDLATRDRVFLAFTSQPSASIMREAFAGFGLLGSSRYCRTIFDMCAEQKDYKAACDAAVALQLFDTFPIEVFCLPLLLQDRPSTMESYLRASPSAARDMVAYLDSLHEHSAERVARLCALYPDIKPTGRTKLAHKPLDKMIRRYAEEFGLETSLYPLTCASRASADLSYWVRQMFTGTEHQLSLVNWRELVERKVGGDDKLRHQLVNNLLNYDVGEAVHWNSVFGFDDLENTAGYLETSRDSVDRTDEELTEEGGFYPLGLAMENIIVVDTKEAFNDFLAALKGEPAVGVDAEFMSLSQQLDQRISLLQVATTTRAFLLDFEKLPDVLEEEDLRRLGSEMFSNPELMKVGFGLGGDIRLLAKVSGCLSSLQEASRSVLSLERCRGRLASLLHLPSPGGKGLSAFCHAVLGKPLSKTDQISDWSRRPLRPSQLSYAALDAFVCLEIYQRLEAMAAHKGVEAELGSLVREFSGVKEARKPKIKVVKKPAPVVEVASLPAPLHTSPTAPGQLRLVCDDMLQGLCKKLRLFGVDCLALENGQGHLACVELAADGRYVLSRGTPAARIARLLPPRYCLDIRSNELEEQVAEVFRYFCVAVEEGDLFSRCVLCNGGRYYLLGQDTLLALHLRKAQLSGRGGEAGGGQEEEGGNSWQEVEVTEAGKEAGRGRVSLTRGTTEEGVELQVERVPREVIEGTEQFWACGRCGKVYWQGSHWGRVQDMARGCKSLLVQASRYRVQEDS